MVTEFCNFAELLTLYISQADLSYRLQIKLLSISHATRHQRPCTLQSSVNQYSFSDITSIY